MRKERKHKINTDIKFNTVRLVGMGEPQVLTFFEAFNLARAEGKDLILISENGDTPIVRIEEYTKFLYNLEKKEKELKKKSAQIETHEIKLSCEIADHDLETKSKKAIEFLEDGEKVKVIIQLKGRQNTHAERGELVMLKFAALLDKVGLPEAFPKLESSKWLMNMKPLALKKK